MPKAGAKKARSHAKHDSEGRSPVAAMSGRVSRVEAVMQAAQRSGLLKNKNSRMAARISTTLLAQARQRTGMAADTDLIAFALANAALEDDFAEIFKAVRAKVDPP